MLPTNRLVSHGRRRFLATVAAAGLAFALTGAAQAQQKFAESDLLAPQALPDIVQGKADAPVTIIEYASMTCSHCAHFHETVYPSLVKNYIDTGKVKFILREFPLDPLAIAGFMVARCEGEKRDAVVSLLFAQQKNWVVEEKRIEALGNVLKQTGMSNESFETCLKDTKLYDQVMNVRDQASQKFNVTATPTFYVNGTKISGELTPESLAKILDPLVNKKS